MLNVGDRVPADVRLFEVSILFTDMYIDSKKKKPTPKTYGGFEEWTELFLL